MAILSTILFLAGAALVLYGIYRISVTACVIAAGIALLYLGMVSDTMSDKDEEERK